MQLSFVLYMYSALCLNVTPCVHQTVCGRNHVLPRVDATMCCNVLTQQCVDTVMRLLCYTWTKWCVVKVRVNGPAHGKRVNAASGHKRRAHSPGKAVCRQMKNDTWTDRLVGESVWTKSGFTTVFEHRAFVLESTRNGHVTFEMGAGASDMFSKTRHGLSKWAPVVRTCIHTRFFETGF